VGPDGLGAGGAGGGRGERQRFFTGGVGGGHDCRMGAFSSDLQKYGWGLCGWGLSGKGGAVGEEWEEGEVYSGEWKDGLRDGMGVWRCREGHRFQGEYVQGVRCGLGVMRYGC